MTRFEKITKSPEALAEFLVEFEDLLYNDNSLTVYCEDQMCVSCVSGNDDTGCKEQIKNWLNSEIEKKAKARVHRKGIKTGRNIKSISR